MSVKLHLLGGSDELDDCWLTRYGATLPEVSSHTNLLRFNKSQLLTVYIF